MNLLCPVITVDTHHYTLVQTDSTDSQEQPHVSHGLRWLWPGCVGTLTLTSAPSVGAEGEGAAHMWSLAGPRAKLLHFLLTRTGNLALF